MTGSLVEDWYYRRTSHWRQFDPHELVAAKMRARSKVTLVLPARDEAATVGRIVAETRQHLMDAIPLLDELVVIDSDSADSTAQLATDAGATVYRASQVRSDLGTHRGKGEALWKSQFVTSGDLLVFMDADLNDWGTHFVTGLLGPLLTTPGLQLVKGFYKRQLGGERGANSGWAFEGGRVTELVGRPLIALRWPELSGLVQPLAGEWAIRRKALEQLHVPVGYGVELGVLVDIFLKYGLDAVEQVDLGRRGHRHRPLHELGRMAAEVLAAADLRSGTPEANLGSVSLRQLVSSERNALAAPCDLSIAERPPAADMSDARPVMDAGSNPFVRSL